MLAFGVLTGKQQNTRNSTDQTDCNNHNLGFGYLHFSLLVKHLRYFEKGIKQAF
jgi:hypothetical protein